MSITEAQQTKNHAYADKAGLDNSEWNAHIERAARRKSEHMEPVAALLAKNLTVY